MLALISACPSDNPLAAGKEVLEKANTPEVVVQGAEFCCGQIVEEVCELVAPQLAVRCQHLLQWATVYKQELDICCRFLPLNLVLQAAQHSVENEPCGTWRGAHTVPRLAAKLQSVCARALTHVCAAMQELHPRPKLERPSAQTQTPNQPTSLLRYSLMSSSYEDSGLLAFS